MIEELPAKVVRVGGAVKTFDRWKKAYKKAENDVVITLLVPPQTRVVYPAAPKQSWNNSKLRLERAYVSNISGDSRVATSVCADDFTYHEHTLVYPHDFNPDPSKTSAPGIHCFPNRTGAEFW